MRSLFPHDVIWEGWFGVGVGFTTRAPGIPTLTASSGSAPCCPRRGSAAAWCPHPPYSAPPNQHINKASSGRKARASRSHLRAAGGVAPGPAVGARVEGVQDPLLQRQRHRNVAAGRGLIHRRRDLRRRNRHHQRPLQNTELPWPVAVRRRFAPRERRGCRRPRPRAPPPPHPPACQALESCSCAPTAAQLLATSKRLSAAEAKR